MQAVLLREDGGARGAWAVAAAVALHVALAVAMSILGSADVDEMYTLSTTSLPPWEAALRALSFEQQPPLYFAILSLWRRLHPGLLWARLFSVACTALVVTIVPRIRGRLSEGRNGGERPVLSDGLVALGVALNPFLLWASFNARCYAFVILLSTLAVHLVATLSRTQGAQRRTWIALAGVSAAGVGVQYYFAFLLAALPLVLLARGSLRALPAYLLAMVPAVLTLVSLVGHAPEHVETHALARGGPSLFAGIEEMARRIEIMVLPMHRLDWSRGARWVARGIFLAAALTSLGLAARHRVPPSGAIAAGLLVVGIAAPFAVVHGVIGPEVVQVRHTAVLAIPAILLAITVLELSRRRWPARVGFAVLLGTSIGALWADWRDLDRNPSHRAALAWLTSHPRFRPDQPVFVFPSDSVLSLRHHAPGLGRFVGLPSEPSLTRYDTWAFALTSADQVRQRLAEFPWPDGCAWLLRYGIRTFIEPEVSGTLHLEEVLERDVVTEATGQVEDCEIRLICRRSGTKGEGPAEDRTGTAPRDDDRSSPGDRIDEGSGGRLGNEGTDPGEEGR